MLFPACAGGRKRAVDLLEGICRSKFGVRGAVNVYNNAVNSDDISYDSLYARLATSASAWWYEEGQYGKMDTIRAGFWRADCSRGC